jgi:hypothetical protein
MPAKDCGALLLFVVVSFVSPVGAQKTSSPYPVAAPLSQYLMEKDAEVALAESAAPVAISGGAEVLVLGREGCASAAKGGNGFVCLVEGG